MAQLLSLEEKRDVILEQERMFCRHLSGAIMEKPQLAVWMILIPVFFVFYFWQLKRYSQGIKDFSANYLAGRRRALEHVHDALAGGGTVELETLAQASDVPDGAREHHRAWLEILTAHYRSLLQADGDSYEDLVRAVYPSKKRFRQFTDDLSRAEHWFHLQLQPDLEIDRSEADDIINRIKSVSARLRRDQLHEIYS